MSPSLDTCKQTRSCCRRALISIPVFNEAPDVGEASTAPEALPQVLQNSLAGYKAADGLETIFVSAATVPSTFKIDVSIYFHKKRLVRNGRFDSLSQLSNCLQEEAPAWSLGGPA